MSANQEKQDEGCFAVKFERKYYHREGTFIKRSLRPNEFRTGHRGLHVPRLNNKRIKNEAASMRFIKLHTNIPVPQVYCDFEDDEAYYLITEYVEGVQMADLTDDQKVLVSKELQHHLETLQKLKSKTIGGPSGIVIPPYRAMRRTERDIWSLRPSDKDDFVFCHNDLSQQNIIVDPNTLQINAIIDWEYAGFFSAHFERPFYSRLGPSVAINSEPDDSFEILDFFNSHARTSLIK